MFDIKHFIQFKKLPKNKSDSLGINYLRSGQFICGSYISDILFTIYNITCIFST